MQGRLRHTITFYHFTTLPRVHKSDILSNARNSGRGKMTTAATTITQMEMKRRIVDFLEKGEYDSESRSIKAFRIGKAVGISKAEANSLLYKLQRDGAVAKVTDSRGCKPKWHLMTIDDFGDDLDDE